MKTLVILTIFTALSLQAQQVVQKSSGSNSNNIANVTGDVVVGPSPATTAASLPKLTETQTLSYAKVLTAAVVADNDTLNRYVVFQQAKEKLEKEFQNDMARIQPIAKVALDNLNTEKARILKEIGCEKCEIDRDYKVVKLQ